MKELIFDQIRSYVIPFAQTESVTMTTDFARHTYLDSLKIMDMIMELEDRFDITLPVNMLADINTIGDLVNLVYNKIHNTETIMVYK